MTKRLVSIPRMSMESMDELPPEFLQMTKHQREIMALIKAHDLTVFQAIIEGDKVLVNI